MAGRMGEMCARRRAIEVTPVWLALFIGLIAAAGAETTCKHGELSGTCQISGIPQEPGGQPRTFMVENIGPPGGVVLIINDKKNDEWGLSLQLGGHAKLYGDANLFSLIMLKNAILEVIIASLHCASHFLPTALPPILDGVMFPTLFTSEMQTVTGTFCR